MTEPGSRKSAATALIVLTIVLGAGLASYIWWTAPARPTGRGPTPATSPTASLEAVRRAPHMLFRHTALGDAYGRVALAPLDAIADSRVTTSLACDRVHYAAGHGVCLAADRGVVTTYRAITFDDMFTPGREIPLPGVPSRVQLAPDGTRAGITVFVSGDSYASGTFSTRTTIVNTATGEVLGNLEEYVVTHQGQPFKAVDFNFWGVTFADANRFYATLASGGRTYLVEGDVNAKRARTLRDGIECPSLSPDGTHVAFKKRLRDGVRLTWRIGVLDLGSLQETLLAETRNVDDQVEWLDDNHVIYGLPSASAPGSSDIWQVPADGSGEPRLLARDAWSPAIVRDDL
jgi:hypothetical protein